MTYECTVWELAACIDGHNRANAPSEPTSQPMSPEEFDDMLLRNEAFINKSVH